MAQRPADDPSTESIGSQASQVLAPEAGILADLDTALFGHVLGQVGTGLIRHPVQAAHAGGHYTSDLLKVAAATVARALGEESAGPMAPERGDKRFADPAWEGNAAFFALRQSYLLLGRLMGQLVEAAGLDERSERKAAFAAQLLVDAVSPTNFLAGNPAALKRAFDTGGLSLVKGLRNFLDDLATNNGRPRQVDASPFTLGENLAATPGKVVFRNDLMELIQYEPQTEKVHEIPILCSPPWINKYYVMDLAPGRSFIEWMVQHGHTVFAISYRNPDETMRDVRLEDYLVNGPRAALDVVQDITGSEKVNIAALCLGGTLTVMLLAYLHAVGDDRVNSVTLLNTLVDFSDPGPLGCFTDEETVQRLESRMRKTGYLQATDLAGTFDILRSNDLIWNYVASNWLMGQDPPKFDILAWNADSTKMPAAMHSFYLRTCYLENQLARGVMELAGTPLRLENITEDVLIVGAANDHIAPWRSSYKTTQLLKGDVRFVLSSAGHIAGIVNPPSPKAKYWTNDESPPNPDDWLDEAEEHQGSWWENWVGWAAERAGKEVDPPPMGSDTYAPRGDAPGTYVRGT